jgi:hypothetical protein
MVKQSLDEPSPLRYRSILFTFVREEADGREAGASTVPSAPARLEGTLRKHSMHAA